MLIHQDDEDLDSLPQTEPSTLQPSVDSSLSSSDDSLSLSTAPTFDAPNFHVLVGNSESLSCSSYCPHVPICFRSTKFFIDLYILPIIETDVVLSIQWLKALRPIVTDYASLTMKFNWNGSRNSPSSSDFPWHLQRFSLFCSNIVFFSEIRNNCLPFDQSLTKSSRMYAHTVTHIFRKIEQLIHDMLSSGLIRHSTSSFSSLVLLVKEKNDSWRFWVDYRSLNNVTVEDRFPIPTIDELLDELHGSTFFTKLDLRFGYHQIWMNDTDIHKNSGSDP